MSGDSIKTGRWVKPTGFVASGALVVLPFVVAFIQWRGGWMPVSDWASIVIRSYDSLSTNPPLVGIYSSATSSGNGILTVYHPGPLQEWLLAVPIHVFAPSTFGILFGSALLVACCIGVTLAVAWRLGSVKSLWLGIVGLCVFIFGTGPMMLSQPLHTWVATYAMVACCACTWAILHRHHWYWPAAIFFGSLAGQAQVTFMVPVAAVLGVAVGDVAIRWLVSRRRHDRDAVAVGSRWFWPVTVLVTLVCWVAPLIDQFWRTGNLWALFSVGRESTPVGGMWALRQFVQTLAVPPSWIDFNQRLSISVVEGPRMIWHTSVTEWVSATIVFGFIVFGFWKSVRERNPSRRALGVVVLSLLLGCFVVSALMPDDPFSLLGHREIWRSGGLFAWLFVAWVLWDLVMAWMPSVSRSAARAVKLGSVGAAFVLVVAVATATITRSAPSREAGAMTFATVTDFTKAALPSCDNGSVAIEPAKLADTSTVLGMTAMLRLRGCEVHVASLSSILPGSTYRIDGTESFKLVVGGVAEPAPGCDLLASFDPSNPPVHYRDFSRTAIQPTRSGPSYLFRCLETSSETR